MRQLMGVETGTEKSGRVHVTRLNGPKPSMKDEILAGLQRIPKTISPKYLYDEKGSLLFDLICSLPEYYPTRTELSILTRYGKEILGLLGDDVCLIELGAGACQKSRVLLSTGVVSTFFPVDICDEFLWDSAVSVSRNFPRLACHAVVMDFLEGIDRISSLLPTRDVRLIFFSGSSIGNFDPPAARDLLSQFHGLLRGGDAALIGYDLRKNTEILHRAYNDSRGITAAFNLNLLSRLNRELNANFDPSAFQHVAFYNPSQSRIEMHLQSMTRQEVSIGQSRFFFNEGERIHTENSYKYTIEEFDGLTADAGFERTGLWTDPGNLFAVGLYTPCRQADRKRDLHV